MSEAAASAPTEEAPKPSAPPADPAPSASPAPSTAEHPDGPKAEPRQDQASTRTTLNIDHSQVGTVNIEEIRQFILDAGEIGTARRFSPGMAEAIPDTFERQRAATHVIAPDFVAKVVDTLTRRRLLVIGGEPASGKWSTSLLVAHRIKQLDALVKGTVRVRALDAEVRVDFRGLVTTDKDLAARVILFQDALARQNRDVRSFLASLDDAGIERLQDDLCANHRYLIFTTDSRHLDELEAPLKRLDAFVAVPAPTAGELREGLEGALLQAGSPRGALTKAQCDEIVAQAGSISRIARLIVEYLPQLTQNKLSVSEALARLDDIHRWFQVDLAADFDAWIFAVSLIVGAALPIEAGVPWTDFDQLRDTLTDAVQRRFGWRRARRKYRKERLSEDGLLLKTRTRIERDPGTHRDVVWFAEPGDGARLWSILLRHHRGVLTAIVPALIAAVEESDRVHVAGRVRAARALGRIGEIDADMLLAPVLRAWALSDERRVQAAAGYLLQGAVGSEERDYRDAALALLDELSQADATEPRGRKRLWTAITICKQIGVLDVSLGLDKLRVIVERALADRVVGLQEMDRLLREIRGAIATRTATDVPAALELAEAHEVLLSLTKQSFRHHAHVLFAVQYALVALCIMLDPVRVFRELRHWLASKNTGVWSVTVLALLQSGGIASELESSVARRDGHDESLNPIAAAMLVDLEGPAVVASFLEDVFVSFQPFPAEAARYLRESFFDHLCTLAKQTAKHPEALRTVEDVFVALLIAPPHDLRELLLGIITTHEAFVSPAHGLQQFARNVKRRALVERRAAPASSHPLTRARPAPDRA